MVTPSEQDLLVEKIVDNHTWGAGAAMVAIPLPGADMAATFAVWGRMIVEIGRAYGHQVSLEDATRLASDLLRGAVLTTLAWFSSAKLASALLKLFPGAGTVTAYLLDAAIAAFGAKKVTSSVGLAAAMYFKSGRRLAPRDLWGHLRNALGDGRMIAEALASVPSGDGKH